MPRWASVLPLCLVAAATIAGCGSPVDTSNLTQVQMSSSQALPPPYGSAQAVLTSATSLATFRKAMSSDGIGLSAPPRAAMAAPAGPSTRSSW